MIALIFGTLVVITFWALGEPHYAWTFIGLWLLFAIMDIYDNRRLPRVKNESNAQEPQS